MRHILTSITILALLAACASQDSRRGADLVETAEKLIADGNHLAAAEAYLQLAKTSRQNRHLYQLLGADSLLTGNAIERAEQIIRATNPAPKDKRNNYLKLILQARLAIYKNQPEQALSLLAKQSGDGIPTRISSRRYLPQAQAYELLAQYLPAIRTRLIYQDYLTNAAAKNRNTEKIWSALIRSDTEALQELQHAASRELTGWLQLVSINRAMSGTPAMLKKSIDSWRQKYPVHPANPVITGKLLELSRLYNLQPAQLALLLPLDGRYRKAAEAVRDGFLTAWYQSKQYRPVIKIYNADALNIRQVYNRAVKEGAKFIVGPLEKPAIAALSRSGALPVITLALNQTDTASEDHGGFLPSLIQFGLSPEDEARQVVERASRDGHSRALTVTPNNKWGKRMAATFERSWEQSGGRILEHRTFDTRDRDFSRPVKQLLNIDGSEHRAAILRQILNRRIISETRLRHDADVIFLAAPPLYARQLIPQFRFHKADGIPIYSTSHIFSGVIDPAGDRDMNDVKFTDIPWVLPGTNEANIIKQQINRNWDAEKSPDQRLYALGVDSFHLIPHLTRLALQPDTAYAGQTGSLSMDSYGRIKRRLLWGTIRRGKPYRLLN
ncbi:MAG: penicillin-binding protein activator [Gammaproteobacteria bacterium]